MSDLHALRERAKELRCLYRVNEILSERGRAPGQTFLRVLEAIPDGWQHPPATGARIEYLGRCYVGPGFTSHALTMSEPISLHGARVGRINVSLVADEEDLSFLEEEFELLRTIAHRLGEYLEWKHTELIGDRMAPRAVHWRWREGAVETLARSLDPARFGVAALYLAGSTANGEAGPASDIDLVVVTDGTEAQRDALDHWLEGWSLCLAEVARQQTGTTFSGGILNVQWRREAPDRRHHPDWRPLTLGA